jgi:hypothetical protein
MSKQSNELRLMKRVGAGVVLFLALLFLPWWLAVLVGCVFLFNFPLYLEFVLAFFILSPMYFDVSGHAAVYAFIPVFAVAMLLMVEFLKTRLSGYEL